MLDKEAKQDDVVRIIPPPGMFAAEERPRVPTHAIPSNQLATPTYRVHLPKEGGVLAYQMGAKYPVKGWPFREALFAVDTIKRAVMNLAKFVSHPPVFMLLGPFFALLVVLPGKLQRMVVRKAVQEFGDFSWIVFDRWGRALDFPDKEGRSFGLQGVNWKPQYYCDMVREVRRVAFAMAGGDVWLERAVEGVCMALEFDDGYRYRVQDILGEVDRDAMLARPAREMARLMRIAAERSDSDEKGEGVAWKIKRFERILPFAMMIRPIRSAVREFFSKADLKKLALDDVDFYRCLFWTGYRFRGMPDDQRVSIRMVIDAEWKHTQEKAEKAAETKKQ